LQKHLLDLGEAQFLLTRALVGAERMELAGCDLVGLDGVVTSLRRTRAKPTEGSVID
jgi:hypothetical protein